MGIMKNHVLLIGSLLLLFNMLLGLILSVYKPFNYIMADISIILTTALIFLLASSKLAAGFKIGLTLLYSITGIARMICLIAMSPQWKNNVMLICSIGILLFEVVCYAVASFASKK
jgi:hypothetical protein